MLSDIKFFCDDQFNAKELKPVTKIRTKIRKNSYISLPNFGICASVRLRQVYEKLSS